MGFVMSLAYETAMFAGVSALHMSTQLTCNFYLALTEEWGTKILHSRDPRKNTDLIRFDKLEKVNNWVILI